MNMLADGVARRLASEGLSADLTTENMLYSVLAIEELETALQIMRAKGIGGFMEGKLNDPEKRQWNWHGYMTSQYRSFFPSEAAIHGPIR